MVCIVCNGHDARAMAVLDLSELGAIVECLSSLGAHDVVASVIESELSPLKREDVATWFADVPRRRGIPLWQRCPPQGGPNPFRMGSSGAGGQVDALLTDAMWVMSTPVTSGQWKLMAPNAEHEVRWKKGDELPITGVSWFGARLFARWLDHWRRKQPGPWMAIDAAVPPGHRVDLPTEAQREYFTRARTTTRFWSGDAEADLDEVGWYGGNSQVRIHRVAEKAPNAFGLFDVHGNVWEWCVNWHIDRMGGGRDPLGPSSGRGRVLRGGSYLDSAWECDSAGRGWLWPDHAGVSFGFRLVLSGPQVSSPLDD